MVVRELLNSMPREISLVLSERLKVKSEVLKRPYYSDLQSWEGLTSQQKSVSTLTLSPHLKGCVCVCACA